MPIIITSEVGIPLPYGTTAKELKGFRAKAHAYFDTVQELVNLGMPVEITMEDKAVSHAIVTSEKLPEPHKITPATIINLEAILTEWDSEILDVSRRLRNYVTNKLIQDSTLEEPKYRLKALELLGKVSTVGLFSEKIEVNVTHRTLDDIEGELEKTMQVYMGYAERVPDQPAAPPTVETLDVDAELSL